MQNSSRACSSVCTRVCVCVCASSLQSKSISCRLFPVRSRHRRRAVCSRCGSTWCRRAPCVTPETACPLSAPSRTWWRVRTDTTVNRTPIRCGDCRPSTAKRVSWIQRTGPTEALDGRPFEYSRQAILGLTCTDGVLLSLMC